MSAVVDKTYAEEQLKVATAARSRLLARLQAVLGPEKGREAVKRVTTAAASRLKEDNPEIFD
jgi:hypothetical protein